MDILTVAEMREIERQADEAGLSYAQMMQSAGRNAAQHMAARLADYAHPDGSPVRILVLVGPGNNGGDGLVCALALAEAGEWDVRPVIVQVYLLKSRPQDDPVYAPVWQRGLSIADVPGDRDYGILREWIAGADVMVDALLGTGTSRPIGGALCDILGLVSARRPRLVVALDGVTGMDYDTGALDGSAVPADLTITFHAPKRGHYCHPAAGACGELVVAPIGIPAGLHQPAVQLADDALVRGWLPTRRPDANKGSHGHVLVIGGCADYIGAPALAATSAYRVGAGLVTLVIPPAIQSVVALLCREATYLSAPGSSNTLSPGAIGRVAEWLARARDRQAVLIGPGMGQSQSARDCLSEMGIALRRAPAPVNVVADADALNILSTTKDWPAWLPRNSVLTPHPGEMARLAGSTISRVQADRIGHAIRYAAEWGHVVVLKGANTVVAAPDGRASVIPFANPAMAVAGMGDVLAGAIAGLMAQGLMPYPAAVCAAYLHARAGQAWSDQHGDAGLLAGDLLVVLPDVMRAVRRQSGVDSRQSSVDSRVSTFD